MTKLICTDPSCKYNGDNNVCEKQEVRLTWHSVVTVNEGREEFNRCMEYEMEEKYTKMAEHFKRLVHAERRDDGEN